MRALSILTALIVCVLGRTRVGCPPRVSGKTVVTCSVELSVKTRVAVSLSIWVSVNARVGLGPLDSGRISVLFSALRLFSVCMAVVVLLGVRVVFVLSGVLVILVAVGVLVAPLLLDVRLPVDVFGALVVLALRVPVPVVVFAALGVLVVLVAADVLVAPADVFVAPVLAGVRVIVVVLGVLVVVGAVLFPARFLGTSILSVVSGRTEALSRLNVIPSSSGSSVTDDSILVALAGMSVRSF